MKGLKILYYLAVAGLVLVGMSTEAYAFGSVSGTVTNTDSQKVCEAYVKAFLDGELQDSDFISPIECDGKYSIPGLDPGIYEIHVQAVGYEYRVEEDVVVTDGQNTVRDITNVAVEAIIKGKVIKPDNTPIVDTVVFAKKDGWEFSLAGFTGLTDSQGNYTINNLPAGTYTVTGLCPGYEIEPVENKTVMVGQTLENVNLIGTVEVVINGRIAGTVTKANRTSPIEDAGVVAIDATSKTVTVDITDSSGNYALEGLDTGTYTVKCDDSDGPIAKVSDVSVTNGNTTNLDMSRENEGAISGSVRNSNQVPIQGAVLWALRKSGGEPYMAATDIDGNYVIKCLPAGTYELTVDPNENDYIADNIDDVIVLEDQAKPNQDFTLVGPAGKITGKIIDTSQVGIDSALVLASDPSAPDEVCIPATTDTAGNYTVRYLRTGTYTISVCADGYVSDSEIDVPVTAGQTTSGKDFTLGTLGGTISGTVCESGGAPIEGAMVQCASEGKSWDSAFTDGEGNYAIPLLQAGIYRVHASALGYNVETLTGIEVTVPGENSGNNFTLQKQ